MQRLVWLVVAILLVPLPLRAGDDVEEPYTEKIKNLQIEIMGLVLLRELALEAPAKRELLSLAYHAKVLTDTHAEKRKATNIEFEKACRAFREEDFANKGFSKRVERKAGRLERKLQVLQKAFCLAVNGLEDKTLDLLTPKQLDIVQHFPRRFDVGALSRLLRGKSVIPELPKPLRVELSRLRAIPETEWVQQREAIVGQWVSRFEKARRPFRSPESRERYTRRITALFEDVRKMSEEEFLGSDGNILARLRPTDRIQEVSGQLKVIRKQRYGGIGRIGQLLCAPCTIPLLEKQLGLKPGEGKPAGLVVKKTPSKAPEG
ncbi:MAG: hypothetical protein ACYTHM_13370 [Planctomycetota bacterium]|jgi:hypothetical protein